MDTRKRVALYTDGSCLGNPGAGGWAALLEFGENKKELSGGYKLTTNNRMEIMGVLEGLKAIKEACIVDIYTDSQYVANAIKQHWLDNWLKNGWKTANKKDVKNKDLWLLLLPQLRRHNVTFHWLKGHAGHAQNEICDEMAKNEANKQDLPEDLGFTKE